MSIEVISKVLKLNIKPSSCKFVLVALANCANDENHECYPSVKYLCDATSQDRKTVLENLKRLREFGYIQDTSKRKGATGQISVYKIIVNPITKTENSTENGTVPFFHDNSPEIPAKESRFSVETVPKTGHGIVNEPSIEPSRNRKSKKTPQAEFCLPDWFSEDDIKNWTAWNSTPKRRKATVEQLAVSIAQLSEWRDAGVNWSQALKNSAVAGWQGLFEPKNETKNAVRGRSAHDLAGIDYSAGVKNGRL